MLNLPTKRSRILPSPFRIVEVSMPHYEFFCPDCNKFFDKILSLVDYEEGEVQCPHCGSKNVEQRWSAFSPPAAVPIPWRGSILARLPACLPRPLSWPITSLPRPWVFPRELVLWSRPSRPCCRTWFFSASAF